jgi:hypothetical protein
VNIPSGVGLTFASDNNDKIESNDTDLTVNSGGDINLTATSDVNLPAQVGLTFGADTEKIEADASNNVTLDATGDITLSTDQAVIGTGSASGKITSSGTQDLVLDTNAGSNSGTITITDGANGNIDITPNGSGEVNISKVDIDSGSITGITDLAVADGGTGASTHTANSVLVGAGASAITSIAPSTSGNVLTSNGSTWASSAAPAAGVSGMTTDGTDITITSGSLVIGTAGEGIDFSNQASPASGMTSELLDSYEEGTWDAQVQDHTLTGRNATMDESYDTGYYTKIGNLCHVQGFFQTTSLGSASGAIVITGLPFAAVDNNAGYTGGGVAYANSLALVTATASVAFYISKSTSYLAFNVGDVATGSSDLTTAEWSDDGKVMIGFSYRVA